MNVPVSTSRLFGVPVPVAPSPVAEYVQDHREGLPNAGWLLDGNAGGA